MVRLDSETAKTVKRLQQARIDLMKTQPFYALLLMQLRFALDATCETAYTDGERIAFAPGFIGKLDDRELQFVLMHEVLHVALRHCFRFQSDYDEETANLACDIVVNSNIMHSFGDDPEYITLHGYGVSAHQTPDGREGHLFSAEEVYALLRENQIKNASPQPDRFDDHSFWDGDDEAHTQETTWIGRMMNAAEAVRIMEGPESWGSIPAGIQRELLSLMEPQLDWRTILNDFVQEEINDYSFTQPDRRFDGPFFLPDFAEKEERSEDILFMIDTSGSMSDEMITQAYSEVKGAVDQFGGKLRGWLGFFDAEVIPPIPFEDEENLRIIRPYGGGGTSFDCVFEYIRLEMQGQLPACVIILTDGFAPWPDEKASLGIPVLWLINNEQAQPPWGKLARLTEPK